ncbi:MAG: APC family permease [Chloroflexi bacterium]|nr:APC family permease [Chloroflexota bacterium]
MQIEHNHFQYEVAPRQSANPVHTWRNWLIGKPLATAEAPHQTIGKAIGLAVFSSDALSSTAYSTQEMLIILAAAGAGAFHYSITLMIGILVLLFILIVSYEQTIHAYPGGGGAYIVARDNLGELPAQTAGAALLTDYILTVAVSVSSGVAQIVSAYPGVYPYRVWIAVGMVVFIMVINLRGVKESGFTFAIPTYFFIVMMYATVLFGLLRMLTGTLGVVQDPPPMEMLHALQPVSFFLILRAFSSGTSALTGVEAISNGITAFKEPRSKNAGATLVWMAAILGSLLLGITILANHIAAVPSEQETLISQLGRTVFDGRGVLYMGTILSTTVILVMAANTAFADFPRLSALHAGDGFLPRQLTFRGSRLVFSHGIMALSVIASLLIIVFQASVTRLIPLYAIGVFLSFTLSQTGMARRWWKVGHLQPGVEVKEPGSTLRYEKGWQVKMVINSIGAVCTFVVMIVFAVTKFHDGAYIVVILTPVLVSIFFAIHHHYKSLARQLSLDTPCSYNPLRRHRVIMPISGVHRGTLEALRYARTLSDDITAVHVSIDPEETERVQYKWEKRGEGIRLVVLNSPYRMFIEPLLEYIDMVVAACKNNEVVTILVPQFVPRHWWTAFLHARTADTLRKALLNHENIVITEVPYQVR